MDVNERLQEIMNRLPPDLQLEVVTFAQNILDENVPAPEKSARARFYICPICFAASKVQLQCHGHRMISCNAENPEDCRPPMTADGELKARAPRWFIISTSPQEHA